MSYLVVDVIVDMGVVPEVEAGGAMLEDISPHRVGNEGVVAVRLILPHHPHLGDCVVAGVDEHGLNHPAI